MFSFYLGGQCCGRRKPEYPEKMTDLPQVADHDKHNVHIMLYHVHLAMNRIQTHNVSDDRQQAIQKCSSRSTEKVFLFGEVLNPRWPPWPLIGPDI
jgi:hypothetical protein